MKFALASLRKDVKNMPEVTKILLGRKDLIEYSDERAAFHIVNHSRKSTFDGNCVLFLSCISLTLVASVPFLHSACKGLTDPVKLLLPEK